VPQYGNFYKPVAPLFSQFPTLTGRKRKSGEQPEAEWIKLGLLTAGVTPKMDKQIKTDVNSNKSQKFSQENIEMQTNDSILNDSELNDHVADLAMVSENSYKRQRVSFEAL